MHGKILKKTPRFLAFFIEKEHGTLTNKTRLYRDILRFYLTRNFEEYIKARELTKWLLNNNQEFIEYYSGENKNCTNMSSRIVNRLERVEGCLESMIEMKVIVQRPTKASKGDATTTEYALSGLGWIIGLFLESFETSQRDNIYAMIYGIFQKFFSAEPSSMDMFCLVYYRNLEERGLFEEHIDNIRHFFFSSDISYHDLLKYLLCFPLSSDGTGQERWKIWKESLDQLPSEVKALFLYQLKLYFDRMMEGYVKSFQHYELERAAVSSLKDLRQIVIELECKECRVYYVATVDILAYLDSIFLSSELKFGKYQSGKLVESDGCCEKCNRKLDFEKIIV